MNSKTELGRVWPRNEKASNWKGDNVGKGAIHQWLNSNFGKPSFCESCGTEKVITYDWANIKDHKYRRDREDFLRMCRSCHRKFDKPKLPSFRGYTHTKKSREQISTNSIGKRHTQESKDKIRAYALTRTWDNGRFVKVESYGIGEGKE